MEFEDSPLGSNSKPPSRYKKALADKARKIQNVFTKYTANDDNSSDSNQSGERGEEEDVEGCTSTNVYVTNVIDTINHNDNDNAITDAVVVG